MRKKVYRDRNRKEYNKALVLVDRESLTFWFSDEINLLI